MYLRGMVFLLLAAFATQSMAGQEWAIVETGHVTILTVSDSGAATYRRVPIAKPTGPDDITPVPPVEDLTKRGQEVKTSADQVSHPDRAQTAADLSVFCRELGKLIGSGKDIDDQETAAVAFKMGWERVVEAHAENRRDEREITAAWELTQSVIGDHWADLVREGATLDDYVELLNDDADGLEASSGGTQSINIVMIIKIIELIMKLIDSFREISP